MTFAVPRPQSLYGLLPAVYRITDAEAGYPLRALVEVLEGPFHAIESDIGAMYDDWFVETCAPGLVPFIGDLVGVPHGLDPSGTIPTVRARVADALAYARRKGPAWVLAQAVADSTGWPARAVELFRHLSQTQDVGEVRARQGRTADLRAGVAVEAGTPFDPMARTVEVRGADDGGRWAADRVALYLWRLGSYPLAASQPREVGPGRFTLSPFGADTPLFLPPRTAPPFGAEPGPWDVPGPVSRELLARILEEQPEPRDPWRAGEYPVLEVRAGAGPHLAPPCRLVPADLSEWRFPEGVDSLRAASDPPRLWAAVDPQLGRIAFAGRARPAWVRVDWSYGFGAPLGGGPYARSADTPAPGPRAFVARVGDADEPRPGAVQAPDLAAALALCDGSGADDAVVVLAGSGIWAVPAAVVTLLPGRRLWIVAAAGERPTLAGGLHVRGAGGSGLVLDGVMVDGTIRLAGELDLTVRDCTLAPPVDGGGEARRSVAAHAGFVGSVAITRSVLGPLGVPAGGAGVSLSDSIVAGGVYAFAAGGDDAEGGAAAGLTVERCTVFGVVRAHSLSAKDSVFVHPVLVSDAGTGGLTCCYVAPGSVVPARDRCQPSAADPHARPRFTSTRFGDPAFAQLAGYAPASIRAGASDGGEMGAFHLLDTPRRHANLCITLDEFLPLGLEAVVTYVT